MSNDIIDNADYEGLVNLMSGNISFEEFRSNFSEKVNIKFVLGVLTLSKSIDDSSLYRNALFGFGGLLKDDEKLLLYRMSILDNWHNEHEEIITALQVGYKSEIDNILFIEKVLREIPTYLLADDDLKESFIRKCMYALAAHPKPNSTTALQKLAQSDDGIISSLAKDQL